MDAVPGEPESLAGRPRPGCWSSAASPSTGASPASAPATCSAPPTLVAELRRGQSPWSVSATGRRRAWSPAPPREAAPRRPAARGPIAALARGTSRTGLTELGDPPRPVQRVASSWPGSGAGVHAALREPGIAVRRADTFPGLDAAWVRIAVRPEEPTRLLQTLRAVRDTGWK